MTTALERLQGDYYNSQPVSEANPGGLAGGGHVTNFPAALADAAEVLATLEGLAAAALGALVEEGEASASAASTARDAAQAAATNSATSARAEIETVFVNRSLYDPARVVEGTIVDPGTGNAVPHGSYATVSVPVKAGLSYVTDILPAQDTPRAAWKRADGTTLSILNHSANVAFVAPANATSLLLSMRAAASQPRATAKFYQGAALPADLVAYETVDKRTRRVSTEIARAAIDRILPNTNLYDPRQVVPNSIVNNSDGSITAFANYGVVDVLLGAGDQVITDVAAPGDGRPVWFLDIDKAPVASASSAPNTVLARPAGASYLRLSLRPIGDQDRSTIRVAMGAVLPAAGVKFQTVDDRLAGAKRAVMYGGDSMAAAMATQHALSADGRTIVNNAVGGQNNKDNSTRLGVHALVTVSGDSIPAGTGATAVTAIDRNPISVQGPAGFALAGTLAGIPGALTRGTAGAGTYTFARTTADPGGLARACPPNTPFIPDIARRAQNAIVVIWDGRNGVAYEANWAADTPPNVDKEVAWLGHERFIIMGVTAQTAAAEAAGTANSNRIIAYAQDRQAKYGKRFYDTQWHLVNRALAGMGLTPTANDLIDIGNYQIPRQLLGNYGGGDPTHLSNAASAWLVSEIKALIADFGW